MSHFQNESIKASAMKVKPETVNTVTLKDLLIVLVPIHIIAILGMFTNELKWLLPVVIGIDVISLVYAFLYEE